MAKTVVGLYESTEHAQNAVRDLLNEGFSRDQLSLLARDARDDRATRGDRTTVDKETVERGNLSGEGAGLGAGAGGLVGALGGLLVGLGTLFLPGLGLVLAVGPLVSTLIGLGIGAGLGALVGALIGAGVPEHEAEYYAEGVRRGGTLLAVEASDADASRAVSIMERHGPVDVAHRAEEWRREGWAPETRERAEAPDVTTRRYPAAQAGPTGAAGTRRDVPAFEQYDDDFRRHYDQHYANTGRDYDSYSHAYRYGYSMAHDPRFHESSWNEAEAEARRQWDTHQIGDWGSYREAVHHGWEVARRDRTMSRGA